MNLDKINLNTGNEEMLQNEIFNLEQNINKKKIV